MPDKECRLDWPVDGIVFPGKKAVSPDQHFVMAVEDLPFAGGQPASLSEIAAGHVTNLASFVQLACSFSVTDWHFLSLIGTDGKAKNGRLSLSDARMCL